MLSKYVQPGDKIELQEVLTAREAQQGKEAKRLMSQVHDIHSARRLEITMPIEKGRLTLLKQDGDYDMVFMGAKGMYQSYGRVKERRKDGSVYTVLVDVMSEPRRYQRRAYYRLFCSIELMARPLTQEENRAIEKEAPLVLDQELEMGKGVSLDISGGGLRFISPVRYEKDDRICCAFSIIGKGGLEKRIWLAGRILGSDPVEKRPDMFEQRIIYENISPEEREEIIRFIFEEERKQRKKERLS